MSNFTSNDAKVFLKKALVHFAGGQRNTMATKKKAKKAAPKRKTAKKVAKKKTAKRK